MRPVAVVLVVGALALPHAARAQKQVVVPQGQSASGTLSPGTRHGNVLYVSGQTGTSRTDPDSSIGGQTTRALANVRRVVEAAGGTMSDVLKCTVFLVDAKDFAGMNAAYRQVFAQEPPARSTVVVAALVSPTAKVEIECIAGLAK